MLRLQETAGALPGVDPYDVTVLAAVLLVKVDNARVGTRLAGDSTLLVRVAEDVETAQEGAVPDWDERAVRLVKVLTGSAQGVPTDVAAYIDPAAAVRPRDGAAEQGMVVTPSMSGPADAAAAGRSTELAVAQNLPRTRISAGCSWRGPSCRWRSWPRRGWMEPTSAGPSSPAPTYAAPT